eukprot:TRINITY_DN5555_c0_g1_i1.p2 TRINITY_DN5555_c0_g1~~TRINITY_DN5555_c0_g1_i1.p2  ORF type:complete len:284 (+),score=63.17 TRINITY_DN5555_c0_g1_i1:77-853(+)
MAAIPSFGYGEGGTSSLSFTTNELGTQQFFPTSEISAMPKITISHRRSVGKDTVVGVEGSLSDESYSAKGKFTTTFLPGVSTTASIERLLQRPGAIRNELDAGWNGEIEAKAGVLSLTAGLKKTDSGDKDIRDVTLSGSVSNHLGTLNPKISLISRGYTGCVERKTGQKGVLTFTTNPDLTLSKASFYTRFTMRKWTGEAPFNSNELGVHLPVAGGRLTVGAVEVNESQKALLEKSTIASISRNNSQIGLKFNFSADF